jgi:hypothetical protein
MYPYDIIGGMKMLKRNPKKINKNNFVAIEYRIAAMRRKWRR